MNDENAAFHHTAAFRQGLHCCVCYDSGIEIHHDLESSTCDPLKYKMDISVLIVSMCIRKTTRIQKG